MNSFTIFALFAVVAVANAGLFAGVPSTIVQGPSSRSTVIGPDGLGFSTLAPGGTIVADQGLGLVGRSTPLAFSGLGYGEPALFGRTSFATPTLGYTGLVDHGLDTVVAGPSGTIAATRGLIGTSFYDHGLYGRFGHGLYL